MRIIDWLTGEKEFLRKFDSLSLRYRRAFDFKNVNECRISLVDIFEKKKKKKNTPNSLKLGAFV